MTRLSLILFAVIFCRVTSFAECVEKTVATNEIDDLKYYPYVISVNVGEYIRDDTSESDDYQGYFYRVVVAISEIYKSIIIERISHGLEGCCMEIQSRREINIDDFSDKFDYSMNLIVYFEFVSWLSPTSFLCKIHGDPFVVSDVDRPQINMIKIG